MKSCVLVNCRTPVILKGVCLSLYSFTHLLTPANVNLRVSYFLLIMQGMCRIKNAKVGVIVIDLEGILEVSEYKMFYARESRNSKGLGFFFRAFAPLSYDFQNDLSIANLTCLNTGNPLCFQREILISEGHIGCLGGALFALPGSPQVICSHTAYSAWIPAGSYHFFGHTTHSSVIL